MTLYHSVGEIISLPSPTSATFKTSYATDTIAVITTTVDITPTVTTTTISTAPLPSLCQFKVNMPTLASSCKCLLPQSLQGNAGVGSRCDSPQKFELMMWAQKLHENRTRDKIMKEKCCRGVTDHRTCL